MLDRCLGPCLHGNRIAREELYLGFEIVCVADFHDRHPRPYHPGAFFHDIQHEAIDRGQDLEWLRIG